MDVNDLKITCSINLTCYHNFTLSSPPPHIFMSEASQNLNFPQCSLAVGLMLKGANLLDGYLRVFLSISG